MVLSLLVLWNNAMEGAMNEEETIEIEEMHMVYDRKATSFDIKPNEEKEYIEAMLKAENDYLKSLGVGFPVPDDLRKLANALVIIDIMKESVAKYKLVPNDLEQNIINQKDSIYNELKKFSNQKEHLNIAQLSGRTTKQRLS